jgi:hypothetical protein
MLTTRQSAEGRLGVKGCRYVCVGEDGGVPHIADDFAATPKSSESGQEETSVVQYAGPHRGVRQIEYGQAPLPRLSNSRQNARAPHRLTNSP